MNYNPITLTHIKSLGYTGRTGHPCIYDALDKAAKLIDPKSYLEIGVFDGASLASVIQASPNLARIYLCDTFGNDWVQWSGGNGGAPQGTHAHIDKLLETFKYQGHTEILVGNSNDTVHAIPKYPLFDLITVDGDHNYKAAYNDVNNVLPLLRTGGLLVWDDSSRGDMKRITKELIESHMEHLFTLDDGADATSVYRKK